MNVLEDLHKNAKLDLDQLSRVSHRLAMTESAQLEKVLNLLLPRLLSRIGSNNQKTQELSSKCQSDTSDKREMIIVIKSFYEKIHSKLVEMMSHIMKRVRADSNCKLPCESILGLLYDPSASRAIPLSEIDPFTVNLSLTFLTIGVPRSTTEENERLMAGLSTLLGEHTTITNISSLLRKNQIFQIAHLFLRAVESVVNTNNGNNNRLRERNQMSSSSKTPPSSLSGTKRQAGIENQDDHELTGIEKVRKLCGSNSAISAAVYDLLLDVLLYQTTASAAGNGLPPPGLSSFGKDRLCSGASTIEKTWVAEYATNGRLRDLKLTVLDLIAPCRQWDLFYLSRKIEDGDQAVTLSRGVSLMVVACGDQHADVSDKANSYLKAYMNSMRSQSNSKNENNNDNNGGSVMMLDLLGHPIVLASTLMRLILGDVVSDNLFSKKLIEKDSGLQTSLGLFQSDNLDGCSNNGTYQSILMSTKRRMVAEKTATTNLTFIAKILDENPKIFSISSKPSSSRIDQIMTCYNAACILGSFVQAVVKKFVGTGVTLSGSSVNSSAGNSSVAAARLLNSCCVRLVPFYEQLRSLQTIKYFSQLNEQLGDDGFLETTLTNFFSVACSIVSVASSSHSGNVSSSSGVEARDAGYITISTLARCSLPHVEVLFNRGEKTSHDKLLSSGTATMLFGCLVNETETLKPRVIAALDSLLASYCRIVAKLSTGSESLEQVPKISGENPWMQVVPTDEDLSKKRNADNLSKLLQPLLWNAAKTTQPKASRHAAAKWASELLKQVDLKNACHILCFIAGDKDGASVALAKDALGLSSQMGDDISLTSNGKDIVTPDFVDLIDVVFSDRDVDASKWRPSYWDFSPRGQGTALRFGAMCLLGDLYGNDDEVFGVYLSKIGETLQSFRQSNNGLSRKDKDSIELLDEASISLVFCLKESSFARQTTVRHACKISHGDIAELATTAASSKARRYLASALGCILEDISIWDCSEDASKWVRNTKIGDIVRNCSSKMKKVSSNNCIVNEIHGSAFLGATCIRALRLLEVTKDTMCDELDQCFQYNASILNSLGTGLLHQDEVVGNACSKSIAIAFSCDQNDAISLHSHLSEASLGVLMHLSMALKKFGNGDFTDSTRAALLAKATGVTLVATTIRASEFQSIGSARLECVKEMFALLGSNSYKNDPEMMLDVGLGLTQYADAYSPEGSKWTYPTIAKPKEFDDSYANELPPHAQVSIYSPTTYR